MRAIQCQQGNEEMKYLQKRAMKTRSIDREKKNFGIVNDDFFVLCIFWCIFDVSDKPILKGYDVFGVVLLCYTGGGIKIGDLECKGI